MFWQLFVNQILNDKEYNSGIRICKVMFEALQNAKLDMFEECLQKEKKSNILTSFLECEFFTEPIKKRESTMFNTCLESISALHHTNDEFEIKIHNGFPPMTMLWQSYLDMVQILIDFLKSISLPNWNLHLESTERMLAWLITEDILVTIGAVSKRFKINFLQFINNFNMETFPRDVQKENLMCFLHVMCLDHK